MRDKISGRRGLLWLAAWLGAAMAVLAVAHTLLGGSWIRRPRVNDTDTMESALAAKRPPLGTYLVVPGESRARPGARMAAEAGERERSSPVRSVAQQAPHHTSPPAGTTRVRTLAARKPARHARPARKMARPGGQAQSVSLQPIKAIEGPDIR
jgi:hypothetical protein